MSEVRERVIRHALAVSELRAALQEDREAFRALLGPGSWDLAHPFRAVRDGAGVYHTQGVSTCGLVAAGILGRVLQLPWAGADYWRFPAPYHALDIVSCLTLLGQRTGARRPAGERPLPGDIVCIGTGLATHVFTCVGWDGDVCVSVDGGAVDDAQHGYLQRAKISRRAWPGPRVVWVMDVDVLAAHLPAAECLEPDWLATKAGVQYALRSLEYEPGPLDGVAGGRTRSAVLKLQQACGIEESGCADDATRQALRNLVHAESVAR